MRTQHIGILLIGFCLNSYAHAHHEAIDSGWCSNGRTTILGEFRLNKPLLKYCKGEPNAVCEIMKSCGQFDDDDYAVARRMAERLCYQFSELELRAANEGDHGTVRPIFHGPLVFKNKEPDHHTLYQLEQGISFSCSLCSIDADLAPFEPIRESK